MHSWLNDLYWTKIVALQPKNQLPIISTEVFAIELIVKENSNQPYLISMDSLDSLHILYNIQLQKISYDLR